MKPRGAIIRGNFTDIKCLWPPNISFICLFVFFTWLVFYDVPKNISLKRRRPTLCMGETHDHRQVADKPCIIWRERKPLWGGLERSSLVWYSLFRRRMEIKCLWQKKFEDIFVYIVDTIDITVYDTPDWSIVVMGCIFGIYWISVKYRSWFTETLG